MSKIERLGSPIRIYRYQQKPIISIVTLVLLIIFFIFIGLYTLYNYGGLIRIHGPIIVFFPSLQKTLLPISGIIFCCLFLALIFQKSNYFIALYQNGLINHQNQQYQIIYWQNISGVATSIGIQNCFSPKPKQIHTCILILKNNKKISLNPIVANFPDLITQIKSKLYPTLTPVLKNQFQMGDLVYFGDIKASDKNIILKDNYYSWNEIKAISSTSGILVIELSNQKKINIQIGKIYNFEIMIELLKTISIR